MQLFILQHVAAIIYALMRFAGQIAGSFLLVRVQRRHLFIVSALCVSLGKSLRSHSRAHLSGKVTAFFRRFRPHGHLLLSDLGLRSRRRRYRRLFSLDRGQRHRGCLPHRNRSDPVVLLGYVACASTPINSSDTVLRGLVHFNYKLYLAAQLHT